jgi:hypothetical protein
MIANAIEQVLVERTSETPVPISQVPLPPSERDFEVYGLITVEGESTRTAARMMGISQTRVIQIRDQVAEWMASEVPHLAKATPAQRLAVGARIAHDRFDYLYAQAMQAWRDSKDLPAHIHDSQQHCSSRPARGSFGDPRYVMLAARIAMKTIGLQVAIEKAAAARGQGTEDRGQESSKFEVQGSKLEGEESGLEVEQQRQSEGTGEAENPPVRGCSVFLAEEESSAPVEEKAVAASATRPVVSEENRRKRRAFFGGLASSDGDCSPGPQSLGPQMTRGIAATATIPR